MKTQILKRLMLKDKKEDFFHSSGYAKSQSGINIGVSSTESFEKRRKIDLKRRMVKRYGDSRVVNDLGRERARIQVATRQEMKKREENKSRFAPKKEEPTRTLAGGVGSAETKRAMMPRKNPGIFR